MMLSSTVAVAGGAILYVFRTLECEAICWGTELQRLLAVIVLIQLNREKEKQL